MVTGGGVKPASGLFVEHYTNHGGAGLAEHVGVASQQAEAAGVALGDDEGAAGAHGDGLAVGKQAAGGGVDEDDVEGVGELAEQLGEHRAGEQFLRIRGYGAGGEYGEVAQVGHALDDVGTAATGQEGRQAGAVVDAEQLVLARMAQVGVDDEGALAQLREDHAEVGGDPRASFVPAGAGDGEGFLLGAGVEPAQHELAAQGAERFDLRGERLVGGDHGGLDGALPGGEIGVVELAQQGLFDVGVGDEAELLGGVAEAEAVFALQAQDALGVFGLELAGIDEQRANGAVGFGARHGDGFVRGVDDAVKCGHGHWAPACGASADVWLCGADAAVLIGALAKLCGAWAARGFVRRCWWVTACGLTHPTRTAGERVWVFA